MTQFEYDTIVKCIQSGAPAIAGQLITSFNNILKELDKIENTNTENEQSETKGEE